MQQFADEHLFGPLGIRDYDWRRGPNEETAGGFGIELKPRDAAKPGLLYLNQARGRGADFCLKIGYTNRQPSIRTWAKTTE
ncbi:hypothetical protein [Paenibacillus thiaminolyticus]|uniref:Uncharacterized protein n=1 Tax=Paenibacillus thiaminolyticus TaxID=49283 RepID=A0A3A3G870_PANTH|nr:hypothetical protein [Paenibacillus thiaminolyticus]RJG15349.1 hypothetical protein DQX05_29790 [Paenibacillus thiaminolyticus]